MFPPKLLALLLALQLNSALTPRPGAKPSLPKVDENACPFEGCHFGRWTARESVQLYSTWKEDRTQARVIAKGATVTAITGIWVTSEPAEIQVTARMPEYGLQPGDTIFGYMNKGEGFFSAWFNGKWVEEFDGSTITNADGSGCQHDCRGKFIRAAIGDWWVEIKTEDGKIAWTKDTDNFDGQDALATESEP